MDIYVLDAKTRQTLGVIDDAESVIWTPRYCGIGEFEIYAACTQGLVDLLQADRYVVRSGSDMVGVVQDIRIETDIEGGDHILVKGPCAKSIVGRRIAWGMQVYRGSVEDCSRQAISDNCISPAIPDRSIKELSLGTRMGLPGKIDTQVTGKNLADTIVSWCKSAGIGWRVSLGPSRGFVVDFYSGQDRSDAQSTNPRVTFSPDYDNLFSSGYRYDSSGMVNAVLVGGEGEGTERKTVAVGSVSGIGRREMFVDARNTSSKGNEELTPDEYTAMLTQQGLEAIAESADVCSYEGDADDGGVFTINRHYFMGDIVNVVNKYGIKGTSRIVEVIECEDSAGYTSTPVFEDWRLA